MKQARERYETLEQIRARSLRERRVPIYLGHDDGRWCLWVDLFREFWSQVAIAALLTHAHRLWPMSAKRLGNEYSVSPL